MTGTVYVRWKRGEPREGRTLLPMSPTHDMAAEPCANPTCDDVLGDGTPVQLLAIGPEAGDAEALEKHRAGRWYSAVALVAHARCVGTTVDQGEA